jgi:hypothetical protein
MFPKVEQGPTAATPEGKKQMLANELKSLKFEMKVMKKEQNASGMYIATLNILRPNPNQTKCSV